MYEPSPALHFAALIPWYGLHFVKEQTWDRQIAAYKNWARAHAHRVYSNGDLYFGYVAISSLGRLERYGFCVGPASDMVILVMFFPAREGGRPMFLQKCEECATSVAVPVYMFVSKKAQKERVVITACSAEASSCKKSKACKSYSFSL